MRLLPGKYIRPFAVVSATVFIFIAFFGLLFGMSMQPDGKMPNCPFMNNTASICTMNPLEHIMAWRSIFVALPLKENSFIFSLVVLMLALFLLPKFFDQFLKYQNLFYLQRYRYLRKVFIRHPLQEAFSNGILNPKIF